MSNYWVYENWRAHGHRATVHLGVCSHCKDGKGQKNGTSPANGEWHGPYRSSAEAVGKAQALAKLTRTCKVCAP